MNKVWYVVGTVIDRLTEELEASGRHAIKTATIRARCASYIDLSCDSEDAEYLAGIGFGQIIQSCLNNRGFRSIREGMFINLDKCTDIEYLTALYKNAEISAEERIVIRDRISALAQKHDGQSSLIIEGNKILGIREGMTEEEFMRRLEADAV